MDLGSAHLNLTIDIESDPITGSVAVGPGDPHPFSGWMELADAIEMARQRSQDEAGSRSGVASSSTGVPPVPD